MEESKVKTVLQWPIPRDTKQLCAFIGLTDYYRRFIKGYVVIVTTFTDLLKKDWFSWNEVAAEAFASLKKAITVAPVLSLPDFSQHFVLETDASGIGIGAVFSQKGHPIAFFSKKLNPHMQHKSAYVREMYAIIEVITKFRHYLLGHQFIIKSDQQSFRALLDQNLQTPEQQKWLPKLLGYDFKIKYKPGKENIPADCLS